MTAETGGTTALPEGNIFRTSNESNKDDVGIEGGLTKLQGSIPQETKDYLNEAKSRILNPAFIRPPKEFFGIGEDRPFFLEKDKALTYSRVQRNFRYFYLNYGLLATILFCFSLIFGNGVIVHFIALALAWAVVIKATSSGSFEYKGFSVTQKEATTVMSVISIFLLMFFLKDAFWWSFTTSCIIMSVHSLLRDSTSLNIEDQEGKFSIPGDIGEATSLLSGAK